MTDAPEYQTFPSDAPEPEAREPEPIVVAAAPAPEAPPVVATPSPPVDKRQRWYCVDVYGPRTKCPPFQSDEHLNRDVNDPNAGHVTCPACGSRSVHRAENFDNAVAAHPTAPPDPRFPQRVAY